MQRAGQLLLLAVAAVSLAHAAGDDEAGRRVYSQFQRDGLMGLEDAITGEVVLPARYHFISLPSEGLVRADLDGRVAYLDVEGRERIPFSAGWETGGDFSEGLARVRRDGLWGFIDAGGEVVIEPRFYFVEDFHDGRALVRNENADDSYIDRRGERITDRWFDYAEEFRDGYAVVGIVRDHEQEVGILRRDGELVLEIAYYRIENHGDGRLVVLRREGEEMYPEYTEGTFTDGSPIEWNDNMAPVNAMVRRAKTFVGRFGRLLDVWLEGGCPCRHPRFRELTLHSPERESLFDIARARFLDEVEGDRDVRNYTCRVCGSRYRATWYEYSIAAQGYRYELVDKTVEDEGAEVERPVPFLRFRTGYEMLDTSRFRETEDVDEVIDYLAPPREEPRQPSP